MSRKARQKRPDPQNAQTNSKNRDGKDSKDTGGGTKGGELFEGNHPWVISSPQARTMIPTASTPAEAEDMDKLPIPPETKTSPTPETNPEEILTHLRGLKKAMGQLPTALEEQYQTLEAQAKDRMLSHGHINKLGRLQKQLTSLSTRIAQMDKDWKGFAEKVLSKFSQHQEMYRQSRASLMEGLSQEKSGNSRSQAGSPAGFNVVAQCSNYSPTASPRRIGCSRGDRGSIEGGCIYGHGRDRRYRRGQQSQKRAQECCFGTFPASTQVDVTFQSPFRTSEAEGLNPWDLNPDIWKSDSSGVDIAKVGHDLSNVVNNTGLVGACEVPCPSDLWCTKQPLPFDVLSKSIDPFDLEHFVETGPKWIQHKSVRFNDQPEIIVIDEGICDDDPRQVGAVSFAMESVVGIHNRECCDMPDGTLDFGIIEFLNFDQFWEELQDPWTKVAHWFLEEPRTTSEVPQYFPMLDDTHPHELAPPWTDEVANSHEDCVEHDVDDSSSDMPVSFNNWNDVVQCSSDFSFPADGLPIITFGLRHIGLGRRDDTALSLDQRYLSHLLWSLWADFIQQDETVDIHMVWPQPGSLLNAPTALVLIVEIITDPPVFPDQPVLMLTSDSLGNILEAPRANYVNWPAVRGDVLKEFHHFEWCIPKGFRECQLLCGGQEVQVNGAHEDAFVVNKGSLCHFILGELPAQILQATAWFPNYERFAKTAMFEHVHGKGDFAIRLHGVGRRDRLISFPYRDILHPQDLWWQLVGNRMDCSIDVLQFLFLSTLNMPLNPDDPSGIYHVLEFDCEAFPEITCVFVTHRSAQNHFSHQGTNALRIRRGSSLQDIHNALCHQCDCNPHDAFLFHVGATRVDNFQDAVEGTVFSHTVGSSMSTLPVNRDCHPTRSRSPRRILEHVDSASLLQSMITRVRRRLNVNTHDNIQLGAVCISHGHRPKAISSDCGCDSFGCLTQIVADWPDLFDHPKQWTKISTVSPSVDIFLIKDVSSPVGLYNVPVEVVHFQDGQCIQDTIALFQLRRDCDWPEIDFVFNSVLKTRIVVLYKSSLTSRQSFAGTALFLRMRPAINLCILMIRPMTMCPKPDVLLIGLSRVLPTRLIFVRPSLALVLVKSFVLTRCLKMNVGNRMNFMIRLQVVTCALSRSQGSFLSKRLSSLLKVRMMSLSLFVRFVGLLSLARSSTLVRKGLILFNTSLMKVVWLCSMASLSTLPPMTTSLYVMVIASLC